MDGWVSLYLHVVQIEKTVQINGRPLIGVEFLDETYQSQWTDLAFQFPDIIFLLIG